MGLDTNKRLLFSVKIEDCKVYTFTVGGNGGAGKDTSNTGVRITHPPSKATAVGVTSRSQHKNKLDAFKKMRNTREFKLWHKLKVAELMSGKSIEQKVDEAMQPENLKVEVKTDNGWTKLTCQCEVYETCSFCSTSHTGGQ